MNLLVIIGSCCFIVALLLPAYESHGFFKFSGRGWKMLVITMVILGLGFVALFKQSNEKVFFYFLPGILNILLILLIILGLFSVHGSGLRLLGISTLLCWSVLFGIMLFRARGEIKAGSYFWSAACILCSLNGVLSS